MELVSHGAVPGPLASCYRTPMLNHRTIRAFCAVVACLLSACGEEAEPRSWGPMYAEVEDWLWTVGEDDDALGDYQDGDWDPDWDDAPFYGLAFYASAGWSQGDAEYQQRAREAAAHNLEMARAGLEDLTGEFLENISGILYGTLGLIDYIAASGDTTGLETVEDVIGMADSTIDLMGNYVQGYDNYATLTYGPTSISAIFALINLQHAVLLDTDASDGFVESAEAILEAIDTNAWNGTYYLFDPDEEERLDLYPNVAMIIALVRYHQATGDDDALQRAEALYEAIQVLRYTDRPGYYSEYSAETMGAQTGDYTTLSSMNYLSLALALLHQVTGDPGYRAEIDELITDFVQGYLWVPGDGRVYHHWMDGRLAVPDDPEYYCIGCNLQLLYIIWWVHTNLDGTE